jgi:phosphoribosylformylglycinamidine synthase subunit PurQ / glutaminase
MKCAVIAFPGNNCEIETVRAAQRNGFQTDLIRWNQPERVPGYDFYILPGGFSFEDRGRSGVIATREPIFEAIGLQAKRGKIILGICNGAQMVVESGLIPAGKDPLPFALAHNIRRDVKGRVVGTGFYNQWCFLQPQRRDTAFTHQISGPLHLPFAHGEGRFTSVDTEALGRLESGANVAFRYADREGKISADFPTTPNGAAFATAAIVNDAGTIMAIMPHPERFFDSFDGDQIFQSVRTWIEQDLSPKSVSIGDLGTQPSPVVQRFKKNDQALYLEKRLIITDNEAFSVQTAAQMVASDEVTLEKSLVFEIIGTALDLEKIQDSGLLFNPNKETLTTDIARSGAKYLVRDFQNDVADHLAEQLGVLLGIEVGVHLYKVWDFGDTPTDFVTAVLQNRLLCNPNSSNIFHL